MISEPRIGNGSSNFPDLEKRDIIEQYEQLQTENFIIVKEPNIIPYMKAAKVLLTDTSSVAYEFLLLNRPIVTFGVLLVGLKKELISVIVKIYLVH
ncbi:MAG: hypothetical protein Ct9H300mP9_1430 [Candidatus Neomarinimicrobiota bacterium]|nr:MAG: hypothetical protein Ct9H300mP9_1430 [Candidatus Neomarinimicrobiota bacterium]